MTDDELLAERAKLVRVAANLLTSSLDLLSEEVGLPDLSNEYMRGQVELIAYGTMTRAEAEMGDSDVTKADIAYDIRKWIAVHGTIHTTGRNNR